MSKKLTEKLIDEIIAFYKSEPMTIERVAQKFNYSNTTIIKILKDIPKYKKTEIYNPKFNENLFEIIDSEASAYFLGFIITDGNVFDFNSKTQKAISITQSQSDIYILEKFKEVLNTNCTISKDKHGTAQLSVRSDKMAEDLAKYGVFPRKTLYTHLPKIPDKYMNHLVRGIFDGDGCITKTCPIKWERWGVTFCGSGQLMEDLSLYLYEKLNLEHKPKVNQSKFSNLFDFRINRINDINTLYNWIYKDAEIFLVRKRDKFIEFKNHYNL